MLFTNVDNEGHSDLVFEMIKKTLFHMQPATINEEQSYITVIYWSLT